MEELNKTQGIVPKEHLSFSLSEVTGRWRSRSGAPDVTIYRNEGRKGGGYRVEFAYDAKTVVRRSVKQGWGLRYYDLYGWIRMNYDNERDVLTLAGYGDYYREEE